MYYQTYFQLKWVMSCSNELFYLGNKLFLFTINLNHGIIIKNPKSVHWLYVYTLCLCMHVETWYFYTLYRNLVCSYILITKHCNKLFRSCVCSNIYFKCQNLVNIYMRLETWYIYINCVFTYKYRFLNNMPKSGVIIHLHQ